jgi:hypothetical protein
VPRAVALRWLRRWFEDRHPEAMNEDKSQELVVGSPKGDGTGAGVTEHPRDRDKEGQAGPRHPLGAALPWTATRGAVHAESTLTSPPTARCTRELYEP